MKFNINKHEWDSFYKGLKVFLIEKYPEYEINFNLLLIDNVNEIYHPNFELIINSLKLNEKQTELFYSRILDYKFDFEDKI